MVGGGGVVVQYDLMEAVAAGNFKSTILYVCLVDACLACRKPRVSRIICVNVCLPKKIFFYFRVYDEMSHSSSCRHNATAEVLFQQGNIMYNVQMDSTCMFYCSSSFSKKKEIS